MDATTMSSTPSPSRSPYRVRTGALPGRTSDATGTERGSGEPDTDVDGDGGVGDADGGGVAKVGVGDDVGEGPEDASRVVAEGAGMVDTTGLVGPADPPSEHAVSRTAVASAATTVTPFPRLPRG